MATQETQVVQKPACDPVLHPSQPKDDCYYKAPKVSKPIVVVSNLPLTDSRALGKSILSEYGWENQWSALDTLWTKESGWQPGRLNHSSYACGIPQALPCTKIYSDFKNMERVWVDVGGKPKLFLKNPDVEKEIRWGLQYIKSRYGTPTKALQFHYQHNWY